MVIMVIAGGQGTLAGPWSARCSSPRCTEALREAVSWQWQMLAYGVCWCSACSFFARYRADVAAWRRR